MKFLIINKKYEALPSILNIPYIYIKSSDLLLTYDIFLEKLKSYPLLEFSFVVSVMENTYEEYLENQIKLKTQEYSKDNNDRIFLIPKGLIKIDKLPSTLRIKEITNDIFAEIPEEKKSHLPETTSISEELLLVHKIACVFHKNIIPILVYIIQKEQFFIKNFLDLILFSESYDSLGKYINEKIIINNISEAIVFLEKFQWKINITKLNNIINSSKFVAISYDECVCQCHYISYKNINQILHPPLKKDISKIFFQNKNNIPIRELHLPLKKKMEIINPLDFYKNKILKCRDVNTQYDYNESHRIGLKIKKLSKELILKY